MAWIKRIWTRSRRAAGDESGAATVDFVVGAAAGVGLAIAVADAVGGAAQDHSDRIGSTFSDIGIVTY